PFAPEEAAGDLARGVRPLLDVDGEREEVDVAVVARGCGREDVRVARLHEYRAARLLGELPGLELDLGSPDLDRDTVHVLIHVFPFVRLLSAAHLFPLRKFRARLATGRQHLSNEGPCGADACVGTPLPGRDGCATGGIRRRSQVSAERLTPPDPPVIDQLEDAAALAGRAGARWLVVFDGDQPAGHCVIYSHEGLAQVEDVAVLDAFRGRGLSRRLLEHALELVAGDHDMDFILAEAGDWPVAFYERL